jgi:hypothetical protein
MNSQEERTEGSALAVCGAPKEGGYRLHCELPAGHEPDWHKAVYHDHREVTYLGSHHVIEMTETVTWEPVDRFKEAMNRLLTRHDENPVATRKDGA